MTRLALAWFLLLALAMSARADIVPDLLHGEAIVAGRDDHAERARGIRLALTQVLIKACGDDRIAEHPKLPEILASADEHVAALEYVDREKGAPTAEGQETLDPGYRLRVEFRPESIEAALDRLGFHPWHPDRPRLLVLLSVVDHVGHFVVGSESERGVEHRETIVLHARRRGLALVMPKMDSVESMALSRAEIAEAHGGALGAMAISYTADAVLAGTMEITYAGSWTTDWTLLAEGLPQRWHVPEATYDRAIALGLGESARVLAGLQ